MIEELNAQKVYPLSQDQFYPIPQADAEKLRDFFFNLRQAGLDEEDWYFWFCGFLGAPCSIGQIDQIAIDSAKYAERERCAKIVEECWFGEGFDRQGLIEAIRKGE